MIKTAELGRITNTKLGYDHGFLNFWIMFDFGGSGQGFGGYVLGGAGTDSAIRGILDAVGVESWEELIDKPCWVYRNDRVNPEIIAIEAPADVKHKGPHEGLFSIELWQKEVPGSI